jgi:hypothetical protein
MLTSFAMMPAGSHRHAIPSQFIVRDIVPQKMCISALQFSAFFSDPQPDAVTSVCYRGTVQKVKMQVSIRHFATAPSRRDFQ